LYGHRELQALGSNSDQATATVGDLVNLSKFRKQRQRTEAARQAAENRVRFGRDKPERTRTRAEQDRQSRRLDGKRLEDTSPEDSD
jgi:Domain of unknown function (DUF4169)